MEKPDDKYVINQIRRGEVSAFAILVERYRHMIYTLAFQILKNREDAEEVAQDAFFKAYKGLPKFEGRSAFSTWIYRIAYHEALSRLRKKQNEPESLDGQHAGSQAVVFDEQLFKGIESQDRIRFLKLALGQIKSEEAVVLTLFYFEELSVEEIAEVTQLSVSNVKVRLHRGRHSLLAALEARLKGEVNTLL